MGDVGFLLLAGGFYLGLVLVLVGVIVTVVGAVQRSSGARWMGGWLVLVGAILALLTGVVIANALAAIGS